MVLLLLIGFLAGVVTAISPCVLPVLPILLAGGAAGGRRRPYAIIAGLVLSFTVFTLTAAWIIDRLGLPSDFLRNAARVPVPPLPPRRPHISAEAPGAPRRSGLGVRVAAPGHRVLLQPRHEAQTALGGYTNTIQGWFERTDYVKRHLNGGSAGPKLVSA